MPSMLIHVKLVVVVVMASLIHHTQAQGGVVMDGSRMLIGSSPTTIQNFRHALPSEGSGFTANIQVTLDQTSVRTEQQTLLTYWSEECPSTEQVFRFSLAAVNGTHLQGEFTWLSSRYYTTKWLPYVAGEITTFIMNFDPDTSSGVVDGGRISRFSLIVKSGKFDQDDSYSKTRSEREYSFSADNVKATSGKGEIRIGGKQIQRPANTIINPFYGVVSFVSFHAAFLDAVVRFPYINDPVQFLKPPFDSQFDVNAYAPQGGYYFLNSSFASVSEGVTYYTGTAYRTADADTPRYSVRLDVAGSSPAATPTDATSTSSPTTATPTNGPTTSSPTTATNGTVSPGSQGNQSTALSINGIGHVIMMALSILSIML